MWIFVNFERRISIRILYVGAKCSMHDLICDVNTVPEVETRYEINVCEKVVTENLSKRNDGGGAETTIIRIFV